MRYMRQIDGLRAFAVIAVLFHHFVSGRPELGTLGVILFFVISGFLITGILLGLKSRVDDELVSIGEALRLFYARRFLRIFPLYFLVLFLLFALNVPTVRENIWWLATYTINVVTVVRHIDLVATPHFWSLAVEEQFYIIWPFLVLLVPRRHLRGVMIAFALFSIGFRPIGKLMFHLTPGINGFTIAQLDSFSFGGLLALGNAFDKKFLRKAGTYGAPVLAVLLALAYLGRGLAVRYIGLELFCALCSAALVSYAAEGIPGPLGRLLTWGPIAYVGSISYGIYVYHLPVYWVVPHRSLSIPLTFLVATLSWYLYEKPINNLKRHFDYNEEKSRVPEPSFSPEGSVSA